MGTFKPTSEMLERMYCSSKDRPDGVFTRLYRYLLREDIYWAAFQNLYANYEPVFSEHSHGFRSKRSCHTAFEEI